jgi:formylglycine-generating enzyme required for sulfatase activity
MREFQEMTQQDQEEQAKWLIKRFEARFEPSYRQLAEYAALPLVLTPELVGYLRHEFLPRSVPWVAEADFLLSDLCYSVGYEQYAMEPAVRSELLGSLSAQEEERIARDLVQYIQHLARTNRYFTPQDQQTQQWSALSFIQSERSRVADEVVAAIEGAMRGADVVMPEAGRADLSRLRDVADEILPRMKDYSNLVESSERLSRLLEPSAASVAMPLEEVEITFSSEMEIQEPGYSTLSGYPALRAFDYEVVTIDQAIINEVPIDRAEAGPLNPPILGDFDLGDAGLVSGFGMTQEQFEFQIATIEVKEKDAGLIRRVLRRTPEREIIIKRRRGKAWQVTEHLEAQLGLEMVQIPGGSFLMGAPNGKEDSLSWEKPQHQVNVAEFWLGKYAITQAQWRFVAELPQINCRLEVDPSRFKGNDRPVEQVSWLEAVEFCDRLSVCTGRLYRLPSEAEWEYACRAGTTTPFHFGETIDAAIANYRAKDKKIDGTLYPGKYGRGRFGEYRKQTTAVGSFGVANAFGLYDMHGNVWEWCADHWNDNYKGAPVDGSAWLNGDEKSDRVIRGGSWFYIPRACRSAYRYHFSPAYRYDNLGFRVVSFPQDSS